MKLKNSPVLTSYLKVTIKSTPKVKVDIFTTRKKILRTVDLPLNFPFSFSSLFSQPKQRDRNQVRDRKRQNEELLTSPLESVDLNPGEQGKNVSEVRQPVKIP